MTISRAATIDYSDLCYAEGDCQGWNDDGKRVSEPVKGLCTVCGLRVVTESHEGECEELARRWSAIQTEIENEGFDRQSRYDDGDHYDPREDMTEAEIAAYDMRRELTRRSRETELETIEAMLHERGARMMRPYEHWNEDERFMEWSERER